MAAFNDFKKTFHTVFPKLKDKPGYLSALEIEEWRSEASKQLPMIDAILLTVILVTEELT